MFLFILYYEVGTSADVEHFNTSHVLIYLPKRKRTPLNLLISIHLMFLFIYNARDFNQSLVLFQYISCSYLSHQALYLYFCLWEFQYISCSYLSLKITKVHQHKTYFNTSHVLIYRSMIIPDGFLLLHFNTSHVLIYPCKRG